MTDQRSARRILRRGTFAGLAGTTAMTAVLFVERKIRANDNLPFVDYDASPHVVTAASKVIGFMPKTDTGKQALFLVVHWGYGSLVGTALT